ncbi:hypothetical protein F3J16_06085 [Burkholderia sp. Ap-962]|nr:hypothetical protein [Burkholderia sp. Ap-962]
MDRILSCDRLRMTLRMGGSVDRFEQISGGNMKIFARTGRSIGAIIALVLCVVAACPAQPPGCLGSTTIGGQTGFRFSDQSFGVTGELTVNPDGTKGAYTVGDHGYTYIANGMDRYAPPLSCQQAGADCHWVFVEAEQGDFGPGTPQFCVYAIEVEPYAKDGQLHSCGAGKLVIGNGLGRPRLGADLLDTIEGGKTGYYVSMTHLRQHVGNDEFALDSLLVPSIVAPAGRPDLLGRIAYVLYGERHALAVVGDTGPAFGEGSIALHELLLYGQRQIPPKIGPIAAEHRCGSSERVMPPYRSMPDRRHDSCRAGVQPAGPADIRAYETIARGVTMIVLGHARVPMHGQTATQGLVTQSMLEEAATQAGYGDADLQAMASCASRH